MIARISGAWRTVTGAKVRVGSSWKSVRSVKAYIDGAWKEIVSFIPALTAGISSTRTTSFLHSGPPIVYLIEYDATATPGGGLGPYTYSWAITSGANWSIASPSAANTKIFGSTSSSTAGNARVTVTDAIGQTATADLSLSAS